MKNAEVVNDVKHIPLKETKHWNFKVSENKIMVCKGNHERSEACVYEEMPSEEVVKLVERYRSVFLKEH